MKNIVLIGLPGCGKTTLGERLTEKLGRRLVDLDEEIEKSAGMPITEIFARYGEPHFRDIESNIIQQLKSEKGLIISTGGGAVLRAENVASFKRNGFIIFLDRPVRDICTDVKIAHRPLLKSGAGAVGELAQKRLPIYESTADAVVAVKGEIDTVLLELLMIAAALNTSGYTVIGDPIGHSLSPLLHKTVFEAQKIEEEYTAIHVPRGKLEGFMAAVRASGIKGFNATIPHKQDIISLLDKVDSEAMLCGAVNTVVCQNGIMRGYNTDMEGLSLALEQVGHGFKNRNILLIGAGGAARAVALKAGLEKAKSLYIAARSTEKAGELAAHVEKATGLAATFGGNSADALENACKKSDLLINATPLGMKGIAENHESFLFLEALPKHSLVCDLIYNPLETTLLKRARELGIDTLNGLGMLVFQALIAQELFLGKGLEKTKLFKAAIQRLEREFIV